MKKTRKDVLKYLQSQIHVHGHIIGVAAGSGMTTKYSALAGADLIFGLSAGKFRQMGRSSHACYMCYSNSNDIVMDFAVRELLTVIKDKSIIFGYNATDPTKDAREFLKWVHDSGFDGVVNFPTVGVIDGQFREALEEEGISYMQEVEALRTAHEMGIFTVAFVFNEQQTEWMLDAGVDIICVHLGLTRGGVLGAKKTSSLEKSKILANKIYKICNERRPDVIRMVYGGPVKTPIDMQYLYDNTGCQGFIGGSSFERIPAERAIYNTTMAFKNSGTFNENNKYYRILSGKMKSYDYVEFVKEHVQNHYMEPIYLNELALAAHVSQSYLSSIFKKDTGVSFTNYLIQFRMGRACELLINQHITVKKVSELVGYTDYAQFCKTFKKQKNMSPGEYKKTCYNKGKNQIQNNNTRI